MQLIDSDLAHSKTQSKARDIARSCGWLAAVLERHETILDQLVDLARCPNEALWRTGLSTFERAVACHLAVEDAVLAPAIRAMGQRAHALVADTQRKRLAIELDVLRALEREEARGQLETLCEILAARFAQEAGWWYPALARHGNDAANALLTSACRDSRPSGTEALR